METKGGKKKSSSSSGSKQYEVPLGYIIEDVRPNGGIEKFRSAAYSNVRIKLINTKSPFHFCVMKIDFCNAFVVFVVVVAVCEEAILIFDTRDDLFGRIGIPFRYFDFVRTII